MKKDVSPVSYGKLMSSYQVRPQKRWGQNFLFDKNILNKIAEASEISKDEYAVEIGPGLGSLTHSLCEKSRGVLAIEIDMSLKPALEDKLSCFDNCRIHFADILKTDIEKQLQKAFQLEKIPSYRVCANIPYNITTPIIFKLLENYSQMKSATLLMQKEVAQRILASPGSKQYGILTIMTAYYASVEWVMNVSRNCFYPRPDVDSAVINIIPRKQKPELKNEEIFKGVVKATFGNRRKTILNTLANYSGYDKKAITHLLLDLGINPGIRPESLTMEEFILIADNINDKIK